MALVFGVLERYQEANGIPELEFVLKAIAAMGKSEEIFLQL